MWTDIEEKRQNLKNDIISISSIPFDIEKDTDNEIIEKTVNQVVESLKVVIDNLDLANNPRVKNGLPKGLKGKIRGKLNDLKTPKGQLISEGNLVSSNLPKRAPNYLKDFCPSL